MKKSRIKEIIVEEIKSIEESALIKNPKDDLEKIINKFDQDVQSFVVSFNNIVKKDKKYLPLYKEYSGKVNEAQKLMYPILKSKDQIDAKVSENINEANTPWGKSDSQYPIERGVVWYGTPSHGGLGVAGGVAKKKLSPQARALALVSGGTYWYEEDIAWTIPFYEHPEWDKKLAQLAGSKPSSKSELEKSIKRWHPEYFDKGFLKKATANENQPKVQLKDVVTLYDKEYQITQEYGRNYIIADIQNQKMYKLSPTKLKRDVTKIERPEGGKLKTIWEKQ